MTSDINLLSRCTAFTLEHSQQVEEKVIQELQTSAATPLVTALRMLRLQRAILAVGMFSLFESLLQNSMGWPDPFTKELPAYLAAARNDKLADDFDNYKLAINVLKHGRGRSLDLLLARSPKLDFAVKSEGFFCEGDVSEVSTFVDANEQFVQRCAGLIEEITKLILDSDGIRI